MGTNAQRRPLTPAPGTPHAGQKQGAQRQGPGSQKLPKARPKGDEIYINAVLNNRFKVESKIGEGGFGAVYRGVQLATGRKVALKLLHPEMTKDENLVARFRREGMVLCNLRDAHTITTYDFDQTPDGTLYIAMELLEGKSLHQLFHEQAPLEWRRMFKILTEMCSSLAEAHSQGIVHRDLKPENVYLETRPGNPEFVKILDFGIAKVMRGDTIDPQSPQLTATGQTLGTLEYMSPEQLMGKPLDGRSDVYALGVVAYEMTTGRLPFPDAKGPAGLITAQLKQTPVPPSQANPKANLPPAADRVILKCLEKNKDTRYPDVTALSNALQEVMLGSSGDMQPAAQAPMVANAAGPGHRMAPPELLETRRGNELPNNAPPGMPLGTQQQARRMQTPPAGTPMMPPHQQNSPTAPAFPQVPQHMQGSGPVHQPIGTPQPPHNPHNYPSPVPFSPQAMQPMAAQPLPMTPPPVAVAMQPGQPYAPVLRSTPSSKRWVWVLLGLLVLGAGAGAAIAMIFS
jgi:eukaryotic-like serine/threonine-protein kinase